MTGGRKGKPTDCRNGLRNCNWEGNTNDLTKEIQPYLASANSEKWFALLDETALAHEEEEFLRDTVALDGSPLYQHHCQSQKPKERRGLLTPTTKKTPQKIARGIVCRTVRRGPVIVPMMPSPMRKCEIRCSITFDALTIGRRISFPSSSSVAITWRLVLYTVRESVCTGAWRGKLVSKDEIKQGKSFDLLEERVHLAKEFQ